MPACIVNNVRVLGISSVVPSEEFDLRDEKNLYDGDQRRIERIISSSGFLKRRVSPLNVMTSDLCYEAAENVILNTKISRDKIDGLIFISYTPDYLMPATSYVLHKRLGLSKNCIVVDIPQACSGYEIGLYQASMMINYGCKNVLLLVGDSFSKFSDMFNNSSAPIFSDAGTATILTYDKFSRNTYINIFSNGEGYSSLMCKNGGFKNIPTRDMFYDNGLFKYESSMDGGKIFDFALYEVSNGINSILEFSKIDKSEIDYFVMHQANKLILKTIATQIGVSEDKIPMKTITEYGNQCGASIPCTISNELFLDIISKNNKLLLSGFGVGLSWANVIIDMNQIYCSGIIEYEGK